MNKNRFKAIFLSVAVLLLAFSSVFVPRASAATDPGGTSATKYLEIPFTFTRDKPVMKNATGCKATTTITIKYKCQDVVSGIGAYNYVGNHTPERANIFNLVVVDKTTNSDPLTVDWAVTNTSLRIYNLTLNHSYTVTFGYEDQASADLRNLVRTVPKYCISLASQQDANSVPKGEENAYAVSNYLIDGCTRYSSEPFLPSIIYAFNANDGQPIAYDKPITTIAGASLKASNPTSTATANKSDSDTSDDCPLAAGAPMRWLGCPLIAIGASSVQALQGLIQQFLYTPVSQIFDDSGFKATANSFRILGIALVLIAGLVMVISQAIGLEIVDAYTVRKVLPRLVVALIGMALAWPIMRFVVTVFNDLGLWSSSLIGSIPKVSTDANNAGVTGGILSTVIVGGATFAALAVLGIGGILSLLGTLILALLVGFVVLAIRQMVLLVAVLMAPLAIAAYILPGTQKLWHFWREAFLTTLFMFPIIMVFLASGQALSTLLSKSGSNSMTILAVFVYFAPYFLLPFAFKLAGGLMSTIFSIANDRGRGGFDRLKKYRQGQTEQRMGYYKQHAGDRVFQGRAQAVRSINSAASKRGRLAGGAMRLAGRQIGGLGGIEPRMSAINARTSKEMNDQIATGMDSDIRGLTVDRSMGFERARELNLAQIGSKGQKQWKSLGGSWIDESDVINGHKKWGNDVAAQQAALSYEMRKAMTDEDVAGISQRYGSLAKNQWKQTKTQAGGSWIGAAFENQNQHLEYKNTDLDWDTGTAKLNVEKFSKEAYEKKGTYQLSQMSAHTIKQLENAYVAADQIGDNASKERLQAVAESFMSRYGGGNGIVGMEGEVPIEANAPPGTRAGNYQSNSQGAAHVAQAVRSFAERAGVYRPDGPKGPDSTGSAPTIRPLN